MHFQLFLLNSPTFFARTNISNYFWACTLRRHLKIISFPVDRPGEINLRTYPAAFFFFFFFFEKLSFYSHFLSDFQTDFTHIFVMTQ